MVSKQEKIRAGAFVVISVLLFVSIIISLKYYSSLEESREYYFYYQGSVSGLEEGSKVAFKGVPIGKVKEIGFSKEDFSKIKVLLAVNTPEEELPIQDDTRVKLNYVSLITGTLYVELSGGKGEKLHDPSKPLLVEYSLLDNLEQRLDRLDNGLNEILTQVTDLLREENREMFHNFLVDVGKTASHLKEGTSSLERVMKILDVTLLEIKTSVAENRDGIKNSVNDLATVMGSIKVMLAKAQAGNVIEVGLTLLKQANNAIVALESASNKLVDSVNSIGKAGEISLEKMNQNFDQLNRELISFIKAAREVLTDAESKLGNVSGDIGDVLKSIKDIAPKLEGIIDHSNLLVTNANALVTDASSEVQNLFKRFTNTSERIDGMVSSLNTLVVTKTPAIERLVEHLKRASSELNEFARHIREQPSSLIGRSPKDVRNFKD